MTYGQIASLCGSPRAARIVGGIAHWGPLDLPWQRVIKQSGALAEGYPGGQEGHADALRAEGVEVSIDLKVDVDKLLWWPPSTPSSRGAERRGDLNFDERLPRFARNDKLIVIVGPTASGKSALAMELAKKYRGEIICADSRTIYRYMDIGTAKPTRDEMLLIPHHLVNIKMPNEPFSASEFKDLALKSIDSISVEGHLPIMVGGTGLYIDSVLYDYQFPSKPSNVERLALNDMALDELVEQLRQADPAAMEEIDLHNPRRVMRAIETAGQPRSKKPQMRPHTLVIGLSLNKNIVHSRIEKRAQNMLKQGLLDEVRQVGERFGWEAEAMTGPAYRAFKDVVLGTKSASQGLADFIAGDKKLAKKQMTWFKRNPDIRWLDAEDPEHLLREAEDLVTAFIQE
jgi:tRNA dimethylallyltransferase